MTVKPDIAYLKIASAFKKLDEKFGGEKKFVTGLSGGIDSALTTTIAAKTLGPDKVVVVNMPSKFTKGKTIDNAELLAYRLGIKMYVIGIGNILAAMENEFDNKHGFRIEQYTRENAQARIRGNIVCTLAQHLNALVIENGNLVENTLGYFTLYGDAVGAFSPLGDLTKEEEFELAKYINNKFPGSDGAGMIPLALLPDENLDIPCAPSAELSDGQYDPMWWGIDGQICRKYQKNKYAAGEIEAMFINLSTKKFLEWMEISEDWWNYWMSKKGTSFDFLKHLNWFKEVKDRNAFKALQIPPSVPMTADFDGHSYEEVL
jgi:NAD+ synthase (glutamine-hydrolysing)